MKKPIVFMFSGQGSQYYQMGKELFNGLPIFRKWMFIIDEMVKQIIGNSIINEIYDEGKRKGHKFDRALYTYPAIFMVEYSLARAFIENGIEPDYVLGTSMGEFCSAAIANVMKIEEVVESLLNQAKSLELNCRNGSMIAIIYNHKLYYDNSILYENSELASVNYHSHFVIAGDVLKLKIIENFLKSKDITHLVLPVHFGFHSSCINSAEKANIDFFHAKSFNKPLYPFISCLYGKRVSEFQGNYFWDVIRKPILFPQAIQEMEQASEYIYFDLGPSGTLANFAKQNLSKNSTSTCFSIMTPFSQDEKNLRLIEGLLQKSIL